MRQIHLLTRNVLNLGVSSWLFVSDSRPIGHRAFPSKKLLNAILKEVINSFGYKANQEKIERALLSVTDLEEFIGKYSQHHLNETAPKIYIRCEHADILVRKIFNENESDVQLGDDKGENSLSLPTAGLDNGSVVLGVIYKDLHQMFLPNKANSASVNKIGNINTFILSVTIWPRKNLLKKNVTLKFKNLKPATLDKRCMFWDTSEKSWSGHGCLLKSRNETYTECSCNHLTHFAVLIQFDSGTSGNSLTKTNEKALQIITYVGLSFSLVGIALTIISYALLTDMRGPLSQIRVSLVTSLGAGQIIFLTGIGAVENKSTCVTVAALVQYLLMAAFCWMLVEGIYLYMFVVKVFNVNDKMKVSHGFSWGLPALVVSISLGIAAGSEQGIKSYVSEKLCWISSTNGMIWIFIVFVVLIELLNTMLLGRVIKEMATMQHAKDKHSEQIRLGVRACMVMIPLLGITWLFGLLLPLHKAVAYIFALFNSTQGFLIFLLHCVRNSEIRSRFERRINRVTPIVDEGTSIKRASRGNDTDGRIFFPRNIHVEPRNNNESGTEVSEI
ncbi:adhesion G-protein coupled receptor D1-like isoform X2 [Stylophora pistillata]|uniref:adhesion G-protein coupled receptor D1-like isoform X2 n=1 Tax=Stylophora pistillata TaxID=50429 RepID=UPI000C044132|nr:adhesion G-protein coupled receptor D1-like isoform X2 [Stylophora pistillata]